MIADAPNGMVAIDFETAPNQSEVERLATLRIQLAETKGRLKAAMKLKQPLDALQAEIKRLNAAIDYTEKAGLDPHRARPRLFQLYGGGTHAAVIDLDRTGLGVLKRLEDMRVVAHNATFELSFLEKAGVTPREIHCTFQTSRLLTGVNRPRLEFAAQEFLGIKIDKTLQTSDWNAPHLSMEQLRYAATDVVIGRRLARRTLLTLNEQASAYTIQMTVMPAVVRMQLRGFLFDRDAHAALIVDLERRRIEVVAAFAQACRAHGIDDTVPETARQIGALLEILLNSAELAAWKRTPKSQALSTKRVELKKAKHYPPIAALLDLSVLDKALTAFGENYPEHVNPVTGRIHASYGICTTASGRASCSKPNLQQMPRRKEFRNLFGAAPGYVLVVGDYDLMEMRASAHTSGDAAMTQAFEREGGIFTASLRQRHDWQAPRGRDERRAAGGQDVEFWRSLRTGREGPGRGGMGQTRHCASPRRGRAMGAGAKGNLSAAHRLEGRARRALRGGRPHCHWSRRRARDWAPLLQIVGS